VQLILKRVKYEAMISVLRVRIAIIMNYLAFPLCQTNHLLLIALGKWGRNGV